MILFILTIFQSFYAYSVENSQVICTNYKSNFFEYPCSVLVLYNKIKNKKSKLF